jgi:hypothetical protein
VRRQWAREGVRRQWLVWLAWPGFGLGLREGKKVWGWGADGRDRAAAGSHGGEAGGRRVAGDVWPLVG